VTSMFLLYDGRAKGGDPTDAIVMTTATNEAEARREGETSWKGYDAVWYEYQFTTVEGNGKHGLPKSDKCEVLVRYDLPPCNPKDFVQSMK
jgi:hypothetical protein